MSNDTRKEFMIENAELIFLNFSGRESAYNQEGQRNFAVVLPQEVADELSAEGWNVKVGKVQENSEEPPPLFIQVSVRFDIRPPRITMLTNGGTTRTILDESTVGILDVADIQSVDIICSGYEWGVNGKTGVKAYLKTMFITMNEDALERKYGYVEN